MFIAAPFRVTPLRDVVFDFRTPADGMMSLTVSVLELLDDAASVVVTFLEGDDVGPWSHRETSTPLGIGEATLDLGGVGQPAIRAEVYALNAIGERSSALVQLAATASALLLGPTPIVIQPPALTPAEPFWPPSWPDVYRHQGAP